MLEIKTGKGEALQQRLSGDLVTIGRGGDNAIVLDDGHVSRHHARIERDGASVCIVDLGSANGTRVNGTELEPRTPHALADGDAALIGPFTLTLRLSAQHIAAAPTAAPAASDATVVGAPADETIIEAVSAKLMISTPAGNRELTLEGETLILGRSEDCDIVVDEGVVSRRHAELRHDRNGWQISDSGSLNGLTIDGRKVETHSLRDGDIINITSTVKLLYTESAPARAEPSGETQAQMLPLRDQAQITIGRAANNDIHIDHPAVSRHHARITRRGDSYVIEDLGSSNGTFVNGEPIAAGVQHSLNRGDSIRIGPRRFTLEMESIQQVDESRDLRLDGLHLNQPVSKTLNLLQDISLSFQPREFVAVVGVSGAGKSTLLDALNGFRPARIGHVMVNGIDLYDNFDAYRTDLGYVPQDDIIHKELPIARALDYSAQLRLPPDTSSEERTGRVNEVMNVLGLSERRDVQIARLSGGQRKRVSIGAELLMQPGLFFLDEATSGLDPGTESQMMRMLRSLADRGHSIVLVTHATKNVMMCDQVVFLAKGGHLAWFGPPDDALTYFGVDDFDGIYEKLDEELTPETWGQRYRDSSHYQKNVVERLRQHYPTFSDTPTTAPEPAPAAIEAPTVEAPPRRASQLRQFRILSARYLDIIRRDRVNVLLLLGIAPALGAIDLISWPRNIFDPVGGDAVRAMTMLFMAALIPFLVGALSSVREIVKETPIYKRERAVTLKVFPYLLSKVWVGFLFAFYHAGALFAVKLLAVDFSQVGTTQLLQFYGTLTLAAMSGVMWGLLISVVVPREEQAMVLVIAVIVFQLVFSGGLMPLSQLGAGGEVLGGVTSTKWSFQALTTASEVKTGDCDGPSLANCGLPGLQAYATDAEKHVQYDALNERFADVFGTDVYVAWAAMAIILVALFVIIIVLQRRKDVV